MKAWVLLAAMAAASAAPALAQKSVTPTPIAPPKPGQVTPAPDKIMPSAIAPQSPSAAQPAVPAPATAGSSDRESVSLRPRPSESCT